MVVAGAGSADHRLQDGCGEPNGIRTDATAGPLTRPAAPHATAERGRFPSDGRSPTRDSTALLRHCGLAERRIAPELRNRSGSLPSPRAAKVVLLLRGDTQQAGANRSTHDELRSFSSVKRISRHLERAFPGVTVVVKFTSAHAPICTQVPPQP